MEIWVGNIEGKFMCGHRCASPGAVKCLGEASARELPPECSARAEGKVNNHSIQTFIRFSSCIAINEITLFD